MSGVARVRIPLFGRQDRMTRRLASVVLAFFAPVVFFGAVAARAIVLAEPQTGPATTYLVTGTVLAALAIVAAGLMRTAYGVLLGWLVILACVAAAVVHPAMGVCGLLFGVLYAVALVQGVKMDALTAAYLRDHGTEPGARHGAGPDLDADSLPS